MEKPYAAFLVCTPSGARFVCIGIGFSQIIQE